MRTLIFLSTLFTLLLSASENLAIANAPTSISLTIYNKNLGMVIEERKATIDHPGKVKLMYPGIPSAIDTSSVIASFRQKTSLFSQNYSFDVINYDSLLKYHLGKTINYTEKKDSVEIKEGTLLAIQPLLVRERNFGVIFTPYQVFFPDIPKDMAVKPSLFWNIETEAKELDIRLKYLSKGLGWKSDYTIDLRDDKTLDLNSWITISNQSGASYNEANITVLAGEVNMPKVRKRTRVLYSKVAAAADDDGNIRNEAFSGYHIYHIPFKETIKDKERKQISFIQKKGIGYKRYALNSEMVYFDNFGERKLAFDQLVTFENRTENHLGIPLPRGTIRVYREDAGHTSRFIGSSTIHDIPKDENVTLTIGKYFDIVGKERVTAYRETRTEKHIQYKITVSNRSKHKEAVRIKKSVPVNQGKLTVDDTCNTPCSRKSLSVFATEYTIDLKPDESYTLTVGYSLLKY